MRARLLVVLLVFSVSAVAAFALPLLSSTAAERTQRLVIDRTADLDRFAVLAQQATATGDTSQLAAEVTAYTQLYGEPVVVVDAQRRPVVQTGGLRADDPALGPRVDAALRNQAAQPVPTLRPWSTEDVLLARPVGTGTRVAGAVVLRASVRAAAADVATRWTLVLVGALLAAAGCALLAVVVARWVLRPLAELERGVLAVAAGHRHARVPGRRGPREVRALATSFNRMSQAVAESADQQRRLVADASHQLRNPLAALRLRMDTLAGQVGEAGQRTYRSTAAELDRLESVLDGLLALASAESTATSLAAGGRPAETCDPLGVLLDRLDAWRPAAERAGVRLCGPAEAGGAPVLVACAESDLAQVVDVLLDNAVKYAGRGAEVRLDRGVDRTAGLASVVVADTGPGLTEPELRAATTRFWRADRHRGARGSGLGLAIADQLVRARGGRLVLARAHPHGLLARVELPLADEPPAGGTPADEPLGAPA
ncbi:sensor histidine kinase [Goodfellowiella coeruleoviolacea]|uniref:histidine kinase n=1 Tax=Goodfellowiella coeruleoviolacea TaxID=334858 RepID=A0AAE3KEV3_9PSEU|nr:HAMP domain-containing sensor histidine kinase [Goodfellowiella coeruleoviolacea]MCP2163789.1 Signal transduction histidine kinase [Goodfellowiella coeruleoviolacea]